MKEAKTAGRKSQVKVVVMSAERAGSYVPHDRTAVVRIYDSSRRSRKTYPKLRKDLFVDIFEYIFDDIRVERLSPGELREMIKDHGIVLFNERIAEKLLDDVVSVNESCETILVHCNIGMSRSPAVAAGIMDLVERINYALIPTPDHLHWLDEKMGIASFLKRSELKGFRKTTSKGLKSLYPYNEHVYETLVKVGKRRCGNK